MNEQTLSFMPRMLLAFKVFFRILVSGELAARVARVERGEEPKTGKTPVPVKPPSFKEAPPDSALQLLGLLQQEGRFIDFIEEDVTGFSDTDIGAAARVVHQGCRKAVRDHFRIVPIRHEEEGSRVILQEGFDSSSIRLAGNVVGRPPYNGSLVHKGWKVSDVSLPKVAEGHDVRVLASAEVEL